MGTGTIIINKDNSVQEFLDCDEIVGYYYDKYLDEYLSTRRVQIKYAKGNIHIIPVKEKEAKFNGNP